jgi:hypothetical protein
MSRRLSGFQKRFDAIVDAMSGGSIEKIECNYWGRTDRSMEGIAAFAGECEAVLEEMLNGAAKGRPKSTKDGTDQDDEPKKGSRRKPKK